MRAITLRVDDDMAERFAAAAKDRETSIEDLILGMASWTLSEQELMSREPFTPEQLAEIEEALAQAENGETFSQEEVMAMLRERFPEESGRQIIERALESYAELLSYVADLPVLHEDADKLVAQGAAAMRKSDEVGQDEMFADWRAKYG